MGKVIESAYPGYGTVYNIANVIARNATLSGVADKVAVIDVGKEGESKHTYAQLNLRVNKLAHAFMKQGIKKGDRVFVLMPNRIEILETLLACLKIGAIYTPANFRLSAEEMRFMIKDTDPKILMYDSDYNALISEIFDKEVKPIPLVEVGDQKLSSAQYYPDFIKDMPETEPGIVTKPDEIAVILFTAGTTGRPKGVKLTHRSTFFANISNGISAGLTRDDVYLGAPPMFHSGGITCFNLYMLLVNGTIILQNQWTPKESLELIKKHGVTFYFGIATQLKMTIQVDGWEKYVGSLKMVNGGGESQPAELKKAFIDRGIKYVSGYGLTETGATGFNWSAGSMDDPTLSRASECMGKPPPFVEAKIIDENGNEVKAEEIGEIIIRREPTGAAGYWNRPEEEAKKFRGDWIFTGDLGKFDEDGFFYVLGRKDDMIISGGENIYPAEIERAIFGHPKVADVVVVRGKHPQWGQTPKAIIVPKPGETITEEEISEHVTKILGSFKKPKKIVFVDSVPKSATGKIDKKKIKELYEEI
jgi:fatty-acyl-CoA synthase